MNNAMFDTKQIQPRILYYGTPVVLLNTLNEDGSVNISPISSSWALGDHIILGLGLGGKAIENLSRHPECVINLPSPALWANVERLAPYTGKDPVPEYKRATGFSYEKDKHKTGGFTPVESLSVKPSRIGECPIQIEAKVNHIRVTDAFAIVETQALQVHCASGYRDGGEPY